MNDNDRQLIERILQDAGSVGAKGYDAMVRYAAIDGVAWCLCMLIMAGLTAWAMRRMIAWKTNHDFEAAFIRGSALGVCAVAMTVWVLIFASNLSSILAPQGAAIRLLLNR